MQCQIQPADEHWIQWKEGNIGLTGRVRSYIHIAFLGDACVPGRVPTRPAIEYEILREGAPEAMIGVENGGIGVERQDCQAQVGKEEKPESRNTKDTQRVSNCAE